MPDETIVKRALGTSAMGPLCDVALTRVLGFVSAGIALASVASAQGIRPKTLLIYYGYPTSINMTFSVPGAALEFGRYDLVVWGDGLDDPSHPDHANAVAVIAHPAMAATNVFGYVDLGVTTQNLSISQVETRIARWRAMGVAGVLLDDFGYDFGTGRARQNAAVAYAHGQGLAVIANAFRPEDAFGNAVDPIHNPAGAATQLGATDYYLYESHGVRLGDYEEAAAWQAKADLLESYRQALGLRVLSITTTATDDPDAYDESHFFYAWHAALLYGHDATGWGEYGFSSSGASNGRATFRTRPQLDPGSAFVASVWHSSPLHTRLTDTGVIQLDTATHSYGFTTLTGVTEDPDPVAPSLAAAPNPMRFETRIGFTLERAQVVRLAVYDIQGRLVTTVEAGEIPAGGHEVRWTGVDRTGRRVAAGTYFAALECGGRRRTRQLVVLP